ncbi:MAG: ketopantoate reductase C-terminal domain-containing protein [Eubacteriales bacterium]
MRVSIVMADGIANYDPSKGSLYFGESTNEGTLSTRVLAIKDLLTQSHIPHHIPQDMIHAMWFKYMCNVGENLTSALLGIPFGALHTSEHAKFIRQNAMREVLAVANKLGINLTEEEIALQENTIVNLPFYNKPSTLQDLEHNHKAITIFHRH